MTYKGQTSTSSKKEDIGSEEAPVQAKAPLLCSLAMSGATSATYKQKQPSGRRQDPLSLPIESSACSSVSSVGLPTLFRNFAMTPPSSWTSERTEAYIDIDGYLKFPCRTSHLSRFAKDVSSNQPSKTGMNFAATLSVEILRTVCPVRSQC